MLRKEPTATDTPTGIIKLVNCRSWGLAITTGRGTVWSHKTWTLTLLKVSKGEKVKVKCTVVQALRFCTGCTVRRGSRGIGKGKVHRCTGTEVPYRLYGP